MNNSVERLVQEAYDSLKASNATSAAAALDEAMKIDYEHPEVVYALKCLNWWMDRIKQGDDLSSGAYEKGEFILSQWKPFYVFLDRIGQNYETCLYAMRRFVFATALHHFQEVVEKEKSRQDLRQEPGLLLQIGRCYKGCGNYELAIKFLEQAARFKRDDAETISELADVNALLEETRYAKVLFREAFFLDPQAVDLRFMESEFIIRLRDKVKSLGYSDIETLEWMPIYGNLLGVFSVKRELKQIELGRLKQSIFSLENEVKNRPENIMYSKPRLINRYFWLIDYYENTREDPALIEETLLKIRVIDPAIYELYRN
jgi:tetratricopeptide (TPR) repeat protein